jgi:hypothetical protein
MSHQSTLSPSPVHNFAGFASSLFARNPPADMPDRRRRSQHPHNPPRFSPPAQSRLPNPIPDGNPPRNRPNLQHQTSRTLTIDLTNEPEDELPLTMESFQRNYGNIRRPQRPPQLGRSDTELLGNGDVIDLTADDNEVQITASRRRGTPLAGSYLSIREGLEQSRQRREAGHPRADSPGLFMPPAPHREIRRVFGNNGPIGGGFQLHVPDMAAAAFFNHQVHHHGQDPGGQVAVHFGQWLGAPQVMPGNLDYQRHAFDDRKPDHVAPLPPKHGFTRSPTEGDVVICPSCEEELIHRKDAEEVVVKKGGKAPTRKEREEHPFWVLKDCGHVNISLLLSIDIANMDQVYCNKCYQNRTAKGPSAQPTSFRIIPGKVKKACAVEDCPTEVTDKNKWVGVFL